MRDRIGLIRVSNESMVSTLKDARNAEPKHQKCERFLWIGDSGGRRWAD